MSFLAVASCPAVPLVEDVQRWPGTGEPGFPPNGVVDSVYIGSALELANPEVAILDAQGAVVPSTTVDLMHAGAYTHIFVTTPKQPLAPSTKYYLADAIDWNCAAEPCSVLLKKTTVFTTAATADTTPTPAPVATMASQVMDSCTGASCTCGTYHGLLTALDNPATGAVRLDLYDDGALVQRNAPFEISTDCAQPGDTAYPTKGTVPLAAGMHHLSWHGFDLAGNETAGTQALALDLECPAIPPPDAGMGSDGGIGNPDDGGGGGCSAAGGGGSWAAIGIAAAAMLTRRRARARR